ncbi:MAG: SDR family oxidoreductase [Fusobacteria bacterium]|nr:SDR family oxidoreductase [Fusobacteriota bacterium]
MAYAVITGATSGLGLEYANILASYGYNIIMIGRREGKLEKEAEKIRNRYSKKVNTVVCDLSIKSDINRLLIYLDEKDKEEEIFYFINNAGFGTNIDFFSDEFKHQRKMLQVHIEALTKLTHFIAPKMVERGSGNIINVSSLASFLPLPRSPFYCSTKMFINTFTESIYPYLRKNGVNIQAVCPGFIKTEFHSRQNLDIKNLKKNFLITWMEPKNVVELSLKNLHKPIYIPHIKNKILFIIINLIPKKLYYKIAESLGDEYKKMGE